MVTITSLLNILIKNPLNNRFFSLVMVLALGLITSPVYAATFLKDFDGAMHSLDEFTGQGKWAIVMIWASDCHVCNQEAGEYVKFNKAHKDKDAFILGISADGREKKAEAVNFINRHSVDFKNLIDEPENVSRLYQGLTGQAFVGTPTFLLFAPNGELRAAQAGAVPTNIIETFIARETAAASASAKP